MPRPQGKPTVQATLEPSEREMFEFLVTTVREETGMRASEAEVLRKLIRDAARAAGWTSAGGGRTGDDQSAKAPEAPAKPSKGPAKSRKADR